MTEKVVLKLRDIVDSIEELRKFSSRDLPFKLAWRFAKVFRNIDQEIRDFQSARETLASKYRVLVDGKWIIPAESHFEFEDQIRELLQEEVGIECIATPVSEVDGLNVSSAELMRLWFLFKEGGDPNAP